jgi:hypothetical protein
MTTPRKVVANTRLDTTPSLNITPQRNRMIKEDSEQSISQMNCDKESGNAAGDGEGIIGKYNKYNPWRLTIQIYWSHLPTLSRYSNAPSQQ